MSATAQYQLDRIITIGARPETVFGYFTDSARWASWWGAGSTIDPRPGGHVLVVHPGGIKASGEIVEITPPERLTFTYGYAGGKPFPPGASRVSIRLEPHPEGTQLHLTHEFADESGREEHIQGWRYQLALFANLVANESNRGAADAIDTWFDAWNADSGDVRRAALTRVASSGVRFADRFSRTEGLDDLAAHLEAARRFMPGLQMRRNGEVRHCQGCALADWIVIAADGQQKGSGTNVFLFDGNRRITAVTGFWA